MRFICFALLALVANAANEYNYNNQTAWRNLPGSVCGVCNRQSPVNIVPAAAQQSSTLRLIFNNYDGNVDGTYANTGHNVQFNPRGTKDTTIVNQKGTYVLQQFHLHWGEGKGDGSEHRIGGSQYDAEIHFVHRMQGAAAGSTNIDTLSVVAVFGVANDAAPITGIWKQLTVPTAYGSSIDVRGIRYSDLLPSNRDFYYYEGSLTTPPCSEVVHWFVLKQPIQIPASYICTLRKVEEDEHGTLLTHNVRDEQPLNRRIVMQTPIGKTTVSDIQLVIGVLLPPLLLTPCSLSPSSAKNMR